MRLMGVHRSQILFHGWVIQALFGRISTSDGELRVHVAGGPLVRWWHAAPGVKRIPFSSIECMERTHRLVLIRTRAGDELLCRDEFIADLPRELPFPILNTGGDAGAALAQLHNFRHRQRERPPSSWSGGQPRSYWLVRLRINLPIPLVLLTIFLANLLT